MRANYNARRTSVVFNPRARVLGRLGEGEGVEGGGDGPPGGGDVPEGGGGSPPGGGDVAEGSIGQTAAEAAFDAATEAAASAAIAAAEAEAASAQAAAAAAFAQQTADYEAASLAASNAAAYAQQQADYEAVSLAAANAATFAATQMANEAALVAASEALAASRDSNAETAKTMSTIATSVVSILGGPIGAIVSLIGKATGFVEKAFVSTLNNDQLSYDKNIKSATTELAKADSVLVTSKVSVIDSKKLSTEINKVQTNLDVAKNAGIEAAVTQLYQTYAKRNPNSNELAYWSNRFVPTITADEVQVFQDVLYANEPNLRPVAVTTQTASQPGSNLALPIIAAVAGFLIFGS